MKNSLHIVLFLNVYYSPVPARAFSGYFLAHKSDNLVGFLVVKSMKGVGEALLLRLWSSEVSSFQVSSSLDSRKSLNWSLKCPYQFMVPGTSAPSVYFLCDSLWCLPASGFRDGDLPFDISFSNGSKKVH